MVPRTSFVIMGAASVFSEPSNVEDARARILKLKSEIHELEAARAHTGPNSCTQTTARETRRLLTQKMREIAQLKIWITLSGGKTIKPGQVEGKPAFHLLWRCNELFQRLREEGVDFTPEETALISEVADFTSLKTDDLLNEARALVRGGSRTHLFQCGGMIAKVTGDDRDLAILRSEWTKINGKHLDNEKLLGRCAVLYADTLAYLGRFEEAMAIARSFTSSHRESVYIWSSIARYSPDTNLLDHARQLGRNLPLQQRAWFFLHLYEITGSTNDAAYITLNPDEECLLTARDERFQVMIVKEHAAWERFDEARAMFGRLRGFEDRLLAATYLAEHSRNPDDLDQLTDLFVQQSSIKPSILKRAIAVLAEHDRDGAVVHVLEASSSWLFKCSGFSTLSRFIDGRASEMLDRAEQVVTAANIRGHGDESEALFSLAYAQASNGREAEAVRTTRIMEDKGLKCMALLLLHTLFENDPLPDFLLVQL